MADEFVSIKTLDLLLICYLLSQWAKLKCSNVDDMYNTVFQDLIQNSRNKYSQGREYVGREGDCQNFEIKLCPVLSYPMACFSGSALPPDTPFYNF